MTDARDVPPPAPALCLPPNAALDLNAHVLPPHHDSEEFQRSNRHRTTQELEDIDDIHAYTPSSSGDSASPPHTYSTASTCSSRRPGPPLCRRPSEMSTASDVSGHAAHRRLHLRRQQPRWYSPIVGFWTRNVCVTVEGDPRDHLALERTFLGYLRTSLALAMTGIVTAQLFRLQHSVSPNPQIGYFVLGVPLAATFMVLGMVVLLIGACRFWRQQSAMIHGKVHAGGWEITSILVLILLIYAVTFGLLVWVDVDKSHS